MEQLNWRRRFGFFFLEMGVAGWSWWFVLKAVRRCRVWKRCEDFPAAVVTAERSGTSCRWEVNDSWERNSLYVRRKTPSSACEECICHLQRWASACHFCHPADSSWVLLSPLSIHFEAGIWDWKFLQIHHVFICASIWERHHPAGRAPSTTTWVFLKPNFLNRVHPLGTVNICNKQCNAHARAVDGDVTYIRKPIFNHHKAGKKENHDWKNKQWQHWSCKDSFVWTDSELELLLTEPEYDKMWNGCRVQVWQQERFLYQACRKQS